MTYSNGIVCTKSNAGIPEMRVLVQFARRSMETLFAVVMAVFTL